MNNTITTRAIAMQAFLDAYFNAPYQLVSLAGDASFRRYHRIYQGEISYLLMDAPPDKEDVLPFIKVAELMAGVVNVPDILAQDVAQGFLLLQDFGTVEFAEMISDKRFGARDDIYALALATLADLQRLDVKAAAAYIDTYGEQKLSDEMDLFSQWFLPYVGVAMADAEDLQWQALKATVNAQVLKQPQVVVHRDYHSRNLMQDKNSARLGVIDFQDALIGAYSYDLVSLLRDAYIGSDEAWVAAQIAKFYAHIQPAVTLTEFTRDVNVMGVQRHLKVLGIFVRLYQRDGKARYLDNIPKVMDDLRIELDWLAQYGDENAAVFAKFKAWLDKVVYPAYLKRFSGALKGEV